jgi:hypothetical protein
MANAVEPPTDIGQPAEFVEFSGEPSEVFTLAGLPAFGGYEVVRVHVVASARKEQG